jgi:polysaccharide pyruvyl transferase WcaK-like protein
LPDINVFDTSLFTENVGDSIIMESAYDVLEELFPSTHMNFYNTHKHFGSYNMPPEVAKNPGFVCGTNILGGRMMMGPNWRLTPKDMRDLRGLVLFGVGWGGYDTKLKLGGKTFFKNVLSPDYLHSVRDLHTYETVSKFIPNVVYTACPTMWMLTPEHCATIATRKSENAIMALTSYKPNAEADRALYKLLQDHYKTIYLWPQQPVDAEYARSLGLRELNIIPPTLERYNSVLRNGDVDVIGSRLHGGIRAMQLGRRALIFAVDNRAREIARGTNLPVLERTELEKAKDWILNPAPITITLPVDAINHWKNQFKGLVPSL